MKQSFRVEQIDHVELHVPDRYEAARWYEQVLGLHIVSEFEFWAEDPQGPLMISSDGGGTKLALFSGEAHPPQRGSGFWRVAFRVGGQAFLDFLARLDEVPVRRTTGSWLSAGDVVDHDGSWSIYFVDPYGHNLEITTCDYDYVAANL
jgi:catechol 2,3-dioxygenase-like lactoylglutathione lyase family enzyme